MVILISDKKWTKIARIFFAGQGEGRRKRELQDDFRDGYLI